MFTKCLLLIFIALHCVLTKKTLTLVVDTTLSMRNEVDIIKENLAPVLNEIKRDDITNYILLTFGDQDVYPPIISPNASGLLDIIQFMETSGGGGCHENSLAAIEKALQVSLPRSYIYMFTDAQAKKYAHLDSIIQLCRQQKSQVVIFQSGGCVEDNVNQIDDAYYEITSSCGGSIFHVNIHNFRNTLKYIKEITKVDWTDINTHEEFRNSKQLTFTIDTYTKDFVICISGTNPTLQISNSFGDSIKMEKVVETRTMLVIRVLYPSMGIGEYITNISCQGSAIATFYSKKELDFQYGFSPLEPRSLKETVPKPIPGTMNFILISIQEVAAPEVTSVFLQTDQHEASKAELRALNGNTGLYVAYIFIEPGKSFRIKIECRDTISYQEISGTTPLLAPQELVTPSEWSSPRIEMLEPKPPLIDFGANYTTSCKVNSYPKPDIWWENDEGEKLPSTSALIEIPNKYISYITISNTTKNETITCKSKNQEGQDEASINLYINRTFNFDVIQYPKESTIEYGKQGKLYCEVNAYPEAEIKWYHNDTLIEDAENIHLVSDEHLLLIDEMSLEHTGEYKCVISNAIETKSFTANVFITGLEAPEIQLENMEIVLKPGDFTEQECTIIKGIPLPEVTWKYKSRDGDLDNIPEGVVVDDTSLKIPSVNMNHGGFYVCEAVNILGMDNREVAVKVQYAPRIKNNEEVKTVTVGDLVELSCDVDAVPKASVLWDMYQDDVIIAFDDNHQTDDQNTHRFQARANDSGMYHCIAVNDMGTAVRTVTLNVFVPPYIEDLDWETLKIKKGMTVVLPCNVIYGNPVPSTRWQYTSPTFETTVLSRGTGRLNLVVQNVSRKHEGMYQCVAENEVNVDSVKVHLKIL